MCAVVGFYPLNVIHLKRVLPPMYDLQSNDQTCPYAWRHVDNGLLCLSDLSNHNWIGLSYYMYVSGVHIHVFHNVFLISVSSCSQCIYSWSGSWWRGLVLLNCMVRWDRSLLHAASLCVAYSILYSGLFLWGTTYFLWFTYKSGMHCAMCRC